MNGLIIFILLLGCGFIFGRTAERNHYRSIVAREKSNSRLPVTSSRHPSLPTEEIHGVLLVHGCVVISVDYFKRVLAALRNIFGGQLTSYETLLDRARREAILRMKESCPEAEQIVNLRIETSSITKGSGKQISCVEILAYGTAIFSQKTMTKS